MLVFTPFIQIDDDFNTFLPLRAADVMSNSGQHAMGASFQKIGDEKSTQNIKIIDVNRGANLNIKTSSKMLVSSMLRHKKININMYLVSSFRKCVTLVCF